MDRLQAAIDRIASMPALQKEPEIVSKRYTVEVCEPPVKERKEYVALPEARKYIKDALREYVETPNPDHILVIAGQPGIGKTWTGTAIAHFCAEELGKRVFYIGPRHDFWDDLMQSVEEQGLDKSMWYHWWARQKDVDGRPDTCLWPEEINNWLQHGQTAQDFCLNACGISYLKHECVYWKQKERKERIVYGQHLHAVYGHLLTNEFQVVIGDEDPSKIFYAPLRVKPAHILSGLPPGAPLFKYLENLQEALVNDVRTIGPGFLQMMAGDDSIEEMLKVIQDFDLEGHVEAVEGAPPDLPHPSQVDEVTPHLYIQHFLPILENEIITHLENPDEPYVYRLKTSRKGLYITHRDHLNPDLPKHKIWFDATADEILAAKRFGIKVKIIRPPVKMEGEIIQVTTRTNNKSTLFHYMHEEHKDGTPNEEAFAKLKAQADAATRGYEKKGIITFKAIATPERWPEYHRVGHFFANRGTNQFEDCDILVVAGTPRTKDFDIINEAAAIWDDELKYFNHEKVRIDRPYKDYVGPDGMGRAHPVHEFKDHRLNRLLWQARDAEIIQAAHRLRILFQDKPVVLLTNLPIDELPPTKLMTERELLNLPPDIPMKEWHKFLEWAEDFASKADFVCIEVQTVIDFYKVSRVTARKYMNALIEYGNGWRKAAVRGKQGKGRPPLIVEKLH